MAGFEELEIYGILNILPQVCQNFNMSRDAVFKLKAIEVYIEIQRISVLNWATRNYYDILNKKNI